jgi:septal ring factor EnvC (AmiA/AmiB activator)
LKDGEAEQYEGVEVEYVHGNKAVLTIYKDGEQQEEVTLSDYPSKTEMRALMEEKGFVKKSAADIEEIEARLEAEKQEDWRKREEQWERNNKVQEQLKEAQQEHSELEKQRTQQINQERKRIVEHQQVQVEQEL